QSIIIVLIVLIGAIYGFSTIEAMAVAYENERWRSLGQLHGRTWLGLWSEQDEAVNALRHAASVSGRVVPRLSSSSRPVFWSDRRNLVIRLFDKFYRILYNSVIAPLTDRFVCRQLRNSMCGNDRPWADVVSVVPWPFEEFSGVRLGGLPASA